MNSARFDAELKNRLSDTAGATYSTALRSLALAAAVRAYSRFEPRLARFGTGILYSAIAVNAVSIVIFGGVFATGDTITLEGGTPNAETVTLGAVQNFDLTAAGVIGTPQQFAIAAATKAHAAGASITKSSLGLSLVANQDTYALPTDFEEVDQGSFDLAVGAKATITRTISYYDAIYRAAARLSSVGYGNSIGYGPSAPFYGNNPNAFPSGPASGCGEVVLSLSEASRSAIDHLPAPVSVSF
jgi:hypothetical protein